MQTSKRAWLVVGGSAAAALVSAPWLTPVRAAVPVQQVGWWTRSPVKPTVPEGGIAVGHAPDGPTSLGAVKVDLGGGGVTGATVSLKEAPNQVGGEVARLMACPSASSWAPAAGGPIADAPADQCSAASAELARQPDGTWTGTIDALVGGKTGVVSILIRPSTTAAAPFQIAFAPPAVGGEQVSSGSGSGSGSDSGSGGGGDSGSTPTPSPDPGPSSSDPGSSGGGGGSGGDLPSFDPPSSSSSNEVAAPPAAVPDAAPAAAPTAIGPVPENAEVEFRPSGVVNTAAGSRDVSRLAILSWFVIAAVVGSAAAAVSWAKEQGLLSADAVKGRLGRGQATEPSS